MTARHLALIERVIREAPDVLAGTRVLRDIARLSMNNAELPVWRIIDSLKWADDVAVVRDAWLRLTRTSVPTDASGVCFAINGVNMPEGGGVSVSCTTGHLPGWESIDFVFNCETTCDDIPLPSLTRLYTHLYNEGGYEAFGALDNLMVEVPVCLGASALVFREALRRLEPFALAGETVERCFAIGFHDGDMLRLGRGRQEGWVNDTTFDCW